MRSDENVKKVRGGESDLGDFGSESPRNSFSGGERDNLFISDRGEQFYDVAGLAGLDDPGDGRTSSLLDYDRDGWVDLVVASATEPTLQLYRNRLGETLYRRSEGARMVAVRLEGGNRSSVSSAEWSPREGYGAVVELKLDGGEKLVREVRCGDGRAAQNSRTLLIGVGDAFELELLVRWPSGKQQSISQIRPGELVTVFENAEHNGGRGHSIERYVRELRLAPVTHPDEAPRLALSLPGGDEVAALHLLVAMSTHCPSCKKAQSQVQLLRQSFGSTVGVWGIPVDLDETADVLDDYVTEHRPFYDVLSTLPLDERRAVKDYVIAAFMDEVTPATIFVDGEGRVLKAVQGVPTVSEVKRLLAR